MPDLENKNSNLFLQINENCIINKNFVYEISKVHNGCKVYMSEHNLNYYANKTIEYFKKELNGFNVKFNY